MLLAGALLQNSDASAAVAVYEELDERFDNPVVLNNLAWLYMDSGDERALETAREAYRLAPGNAEIGDTLGWILVQTGAPEEGLDHLQRAAQELPKNGSVLYHLAVAQRMDGDDTAARTNLEAAIATGVFPERNEAERALEELGE